MKDGLPRLCASSAIRSRAQSNAPTPARNSGVHSVSWLTTTASTSDRPVRSRRFSFW